MLALSDGSGISLLVRGRLEKPSCEETDQCRDHRTFTIWLTPAGGRSPVKPKKNMGGSRPQALTTSNKSRGGSRPHALL
jgi:hypothetical protein